MGTNFFTNDNGEKSQDEFFKEIKKNIQEASLDLHRMCEMGLFELKSQGRNVYYIAGQKFISLNGRELYYGDGEMYYDDGEMYHGNGEMYHGNEEMYHGNEEMCRAEDLPDELKN